MKKLICLLAIMAIALVAVPARADDCDDSYGYKDTTSSLPWFLNHKHRIYDPGRRNPRGAGVDAVLFQTTNPLLEEITAEYRYDNGNNEHSVYAVARVNVFKAVKGLFK